MSVDSLLSISQLLFIIYDFLANSYAFSDGNSWQKKDRDSIVGKLAELYDECVGRVKKENSAEVTAALLPTLFDCVRLPLLPVDNQKFQECDDMAVEFLENVPTVKLECDWKIEHSSMRMIGELSEQMTPKDRDEDELCGRLETTFSRWAEAMDAGGGWNGISVREALSRLELMNRNSYMTSESRFNAHVSLGYRHYKKLVTADVEALSLLVELAPNLDNTPADLQTISKIKHTAEEVLASEETGTLQYELWSALWLKCVFYISWSEI